MNLDGLSFPDDLWYAPAHNLWLREEPAGEVTLGLSAYGAALYGDIFAFTPKRVGMHIPVDRSFGVVEFAKAAASAKSPIAGTVTAHNEVLLQRPVLMTRDGYGEGWMIRMLPDDWATACQSLLQGEQAVAAFVRQAQRDGFDPGDDSVQALKRQL
ncbi:glycine cleavage system protein H [Marinobacter daepoensis]|uniref:glycine cleavage system protein H n=1 Tax=Marinobacter daepoensis TaxID=262077 RepID=UPI0004055557|nr:glycine cleavage system protein H [Marinobacter daepoensis]MBY6032889.1 glycine cleavage system protein H [Marinobacter daepoensis]